MLREFFICNFLLIEQARVVFRGGLVAITGETGSGKSLFIRALSALVGGVLSVDFLRDPTKECVISGVFSSSSQLDSALSRNGLRREGGCVTIRRVLSALGTSSYYLNDQSVTQAFIQELGALLFEWHGQHASQTLLKPASYVSFLDEYAGLSQRVQNFSRLYKEFLREKEAYELWCKEGAEKKANQEYWQKILAEIEEVAPQLREEEQLTESLAKTQNFEHWMRAFGDLHQGFYGKDSQGFSVLGQLVRLQATADILDLENAELKSLTQRLKNAYHEIEDIAESYKQQSFSLNYQPHIREAQQLRLFTLSRLRKRLKLSSIEELIAYKEELFSFLEEGEGFEQEQKKRKSDLDTAYKALQEEAKSISVVRQNHKIILGQNVNAILKELEMQEIVLDIEVESRKVLSEKGLDKVTFSLTQGGRKKLLSSVVSGGELSRIMLALKTLCAPKQKPFCLVFDEIDAGLGGKAGVLLGRYLHRMARETQVFVITHLATVAAFSDDHLQLKKNTTGWQVYSQVICLTQETDRVTELARMMSGDARISSLMHAQELLQKSSQQKGEMFAW